MVEILSSVYELGEVGGEEGLRKSTTTSVESVPGCFDMICASSRLVVNKVCAVIYCGVCKVKSFQLGYCRVCFLTI